MSIITTKEVSAFRAQIWGFYKHSGRNLPWRKTKNPYKILVSEIMLQQTQVARVLKKYSEFLKAFPDVKTLASAPLSEILRVWQGMGYNRRALALKSLAEEVMSRYGGEMPKKKKEFEKLQGVGPYTAGAVQIFAHNKPEIIIETNIRRVFIHHFFKNKEGIDDKEILPLIEATLDTSNPREWYWALMDYGADLPEKINNNPNTKSKHYVKQSEFKGSRRQMRGTILKLLQEKEVRGEDEFLKELNVAKEILQSILEELEREGFIQKNAKGYSIKK